MMTKFEPFFTIKDVQNQTQQHMLKGFNTHVALLMKYIRAHNKFENI
jgi:hypothetical protein